MSAAAAPQLFMFWQLPAEIRLQIYRELLRAPVQPPASVQSKRAVCIARHRYPTVRQLSNSSDAPSLDIWLDSPWRPEKDDDDDNTASCDEYRTSQHHTLIDPTGEGAPFQITLGPGWGPDPSFCDKRLDFMLASRRLYQDAMVQYHQEVSLQVGLPEQLVDLMLRTHACGTSHLVRSLTVTFHFFDDYAEYITSGITLYQTDLSDWSDCLDALKPGVVAQAFPQLRTLTLVFAPHPTDYVCVDAESVDFKPFITDSLAPRFSGMSQVDTQVYGLQSTRKWVETTIRGSRESTEKGVASD